MLRYGRPGDARAGCSNLDKRTARLVGFRTARLVGFRTARLVGFAVALGRRTGARFVAVNWGAGDLSG